MQTLQLDQATLGFEQVYASHLALGKRKFLENTQYVSFSQHEVELTPVHRWQRIVETFGDNPAIEEAGQILTYDEVNTFANRIAHAILALRPAVAVPVALLFDNEGDLAVGIMAVWKASRFFTWLETRQPLARNQFIMEESGAQVIVTNRANEEMARELAATSINVIVMEEYSEEGEIADPPITMDGTYPAYLVYTSGSTGTPKGVVELQCNLCHFMSTREAIFQFSARERIGILAYGVSCIMPLLGAFMYGGCLLPFKMKYEGLARFNQWLIERDVSVVIAGADLRTWLLSLDGTQQFPALRLVALSTGPTYREHFEAYKRYLDEQSRLILIYSATEFRFGTMTLIGKDANVEGRKLPAGYATAESTIEIWDEAGQLVSAGESGEVVILSPYLSASYWKSPELTAAKFGFGRDGRRYYRTGDLGRMDEYGCLWVLGRRDGQIKIRGNRVECAEVEAALLDLPVVHEAVVVHVGDTDESRLLYAFVTTIGQARAEELRKHLAIKLPDYMVPAAIIVLDEWPRAGNGKIARSELREMAERYDHGGVDIVSVEMEKWTETEKQVAAMMCELLGGLELGLHDDFFDFGGQSLLAARLMLMIQRTFGVDLTPRDFFANPTIAALAASVVRHRGEAPLLSPSTVIERVMGLEVIHLLGNANSQFSLFLCPGAKGTTRTLLAYQEILRHLNVQVGEAWSTYAFVTDGYQEAEEIFASVDELADAAVKLLRTRQPVGPYWLLGECIGGKLAYEMARGLAQQSDEEVNLILLDTPARPKFRKDTVVGASRAFVHRLSRSVQGRVRYHWRELADLKWSERGRYLGERWQGQKLQLVAAQATGRRNSLASIRYQELLVNFEPVEAFSQPTLALFSQGYKHHRQRWEQLIRRLEVRLFSGSHENYLSLSGEQIASAICERLARAKSVK